MTQSADIAIVGAGIAGLAHAYMALKKKYKVILFEREQFAVGASIRNFGLLWPIGQEAGKNLNLALQSRMHWQELAKKTGFWINNNGSLHVAYHEDEWAVIKEFYDSFQDEPIDCELITPSKAKQLSPVLKEKGMVGAMYSRTESTVYSRVAIRSILEWMEANLGLIVRRGATVIEVAVPKIRTSSEEWSVQKVIVCNGADFETLFPEVWEREEMIKCKLQMMRIKTKAKVDIGPSLCAGLTLRHYKSFANCPSLPRVDARYDKLDPRYKEHGIHVLVAQNPMGELIVGDSHHYGKTLDPFDSEEVNKLILDYLQSFVELGDYEIVERWNGTYPKSNLKNTLIVEQSPNVIIVNALGGAGMTLSFGIAEKVISEL